MRPAGYDPEIETIYIEVIPRCPVNWARTAHHYAKHDGMVYDRDWGPYGIDGQPRVSSGGLVWVRYRSDFGGWNATLHIWAQQPSHREAEEQLGRFYGMFEERDGIDPIDVFRRLYLMEKGEE